ncbi:MAG: PAS domain-containing sensor histidine kinase, partial [bacterium]
PIRYRGKDVRVTSVRDISERKKAEAALRESEKRFRTVFETAKDSIFMKDIALRYMLINPAMEKMFGMQSREMIGKTDTDIFGPEIGDDIQDTEIRVLNGEIIEKERTLPINGIPYTFSIIKVPMRNDDELVTGLFGIARDLTYRKAAEEVIRKKNKELASALTVKTEFLSVVSHELRTPLVPILGYSELMLDGSFGILPEYLKEPLQTVYDRADNLRKLIDDLLLVSRTDQRTVRIKLENIFADRIIEEIIDSRNKVNQGKRVNFIREGRECRILADPDRLRQVLQNLIQNSIKYSEESVDITIETYNDGEFGHIKVTDNGIGISSENLAHVFERFYQVENPDTRHHDGAGLGLSIVKELIELMNGHILAESEQGKGSCFTITLPSANPDDVE